MAWRFSTCVAAALCLLAFCGAAVQAESQAWESAEELLVQGKLKEAEESLAGALATDSGDDEARFGLGIVQTLRGVEKLVQGLHRYGLEPRWASQLPFVRLPVPANPDPEPLTNEAFRGLVAEFAGDLAKVEKTLVEVDSDDVKLVVRPGAYRVDFDRNGEATDDELLWRLLFRLTGATMRAEDAGQFVIAMDKADTHWLRGYCHVLAAMCEMYLAHDTQNLHDRAAQFFFPKARVAYPFEPGPGNRWADPFLDGIALIHLINLPVSEPERMKAAHAHLLAMVDESRANFAAIAAETDDDREWIPSPTQHNAALPRAAITPEMVDGWNAVLDEWEKILKGEKLVPFWRGGEKGINVRRVFEEPTTFDLVLWVQGSAAAPYLEEGKVTSTDFWRDIWQGFGGQFFRFAVWVN